jgi:WD40 repeat protein
MILVCYLWPLLTPTAPISAQDQVRDQNVVRLTARPCIMLKGHKGDVLGVTFSQDDRWIASAGADGTVIIWDAAVGRKAALLRGHRQPIYSVGYCGPTSSRLVSADRGGHVIVWDVKTRKQHVSFDGTNPYTLKSAVSPDGKYFASGSYLNEDDNGFNIAIWKIDNGQISHVLRGHKGAAVALAFSYDGKLLASAGSDGNVTLWDGILRKKLAMFSEHRDVVTCVAFGPDSKRLASGSVDGTVRLWDLVTRKQTHVLKGSGHQVGSVAFSPDGKYIACASCYEPRGPDALFDICVWHIADRHEVLRLGRGIGTIFQVIFNRAGNRIAATFSDGVVRVWSLEPKRR